MKLILGTVQFGVPYGINNSSGQPSQTQVFAILDEALRLGISEIDTADAYGNSPEVLSAYFQKKGSVPFRIMSKCILKPELSWSDAFTLSCKRLGVDRLEGFYFHRFQDFENFGGFDEVAELKSKGQFKFLGVSLYTVDELEHAVTSEHTDVIQVPFNLLDHSTRKIELLKKARSKGKLIYARSAFLQGLFFKNWRSLPAQLEPLQPALRSLHEFSSELGIEIQDLALRFLHQLDFIDKIIIGVDSSPQLQRNCASLSESLPQDVVKKILEIEVAHESLLNPASWKI